jgi:RNA polymerase subunit RPABC4/transcription elongation factor Spt4
VSEHRGTVTCPHCGGQHFTISDWTTYVSLWCVGCKRVVREVTAAYPPYGITVCLPGGKT